MTFTPQPGTHATLEVVGPNDLLVESLGSIPGPVRLLNQSNPDIFNSFTFRLTTAEGVRYVINQQTGVSSVSDPYGNTLTINADGVVHSSGTSIAFTDLLPENWPRIRYDFGGLKGGGINGETKVQRS